MFFARRSATSKLLRLIALAALAIGTANTPANAGFIVTLEQVGSDVVATGSGPIDLTGLINPFNASSNAGIAPAFDIVDNGPVSASVTVFQNTVFTGPANFGSGGLIFADLGSGDRVLIEVNNHFLGVPVGYVSGNPLSDSSTYLNRTFSSLGVTPGTYEWTWGTGPNQNFTVVAEVAAVPEPTSLMLFGTALIGFGVLRKRRQLTRRNQASTGAA